MLKQLHMFAQFAEPSRNFFITQRYLKRQSKFHLYCAEKTETRAYVAAYDVVVYGETTMSKNYARRTGEREKEVVGLMLSCDNN